MTQSVDDKVNETVTAIMEKIEEAKDAKMQQLELSNQELVALLHRAAETIEANVKASNPRTYWSKFYRLEADKYRVK